MGKYYCDYCDVYLTHDSPAVRKQHNDGNRHKQCVCEYYREYVGQQVQKQIDAIVASFEQRVAHGLVVPTFGFAEAPVKVVPTDPQNAVAVSVDGTPVGTGIVQKADPVTAAIAAAHVPGAPLAVASQDGQELAQPFTGDKATMGHYGQ
eukprot:Plantae.Rhodophyta-Purpureofilum_apyrenoidigerum.ctg20867.p1 GENE.Plantae.Rhodophyta-Purpureofilum_apyrenoidigerum.ctg20867~~Plantae.Rhodophyta-Purpureofilum_apyrenoidigerum.ctg20867.p1  ORF type:complete len:149 (+),score=25.51 Plantae.Rhodophyta-Purpureofilum_apyrenoidigerum.ctg20867:221-667(+)